MKYCPLIRIILWWRRFPKCLFRRKRTCHITFYLQIHGNFGEINVRQRQQFNINVTINKFHRFKVSLKLNFQMLRNLVGHLSNTDIYSPPTNSNPNLKNQYNENSTLMWRYLFKLIVVNHLTWRYLRAWDVVNRQNSWKKNYQLHPLPRAKTKASNLNWRQLLKRMLP